MRALARALLLALIPGLAGLLLVRWPVTAGLELTGLEYLFQLRGKRPVPPEVCVVAIDEDSYDILGFDSAKDWPRAAHAKLIRTLKAEGARVVVFDVLFEDPGNPEQDAALANAIRESGIVVLGSTIDLTIDPRFRQARVRDPLESFARAAAAVGDAGFPRERDGVVRRAWLVHEDRPSLALAAIQVATGRRPPPQRGDRLIDFYGPARTVRTIAYYQAIEPREYLAPGFFKDRIVFVGLSQSAAAGPTAKDAFLTPFLDRDALPTFGVEIHATVAANLLEGRRIDILPAIPETALLLLVPLLACLVFLYIRPLAGAFALLALELAPWLAAHVAFTHGRVWIPVMTPAIVQLPAAYVICLVWYYLTTVRQRERIRKAFSFYLSPEMIERITSDPSSLNLGGEEIVATVLMTDIKGFTPIAESMPARETAALLNAYFSAVTKHIFREGGTLIKFIGDAVFAIWGAPLRMEDHASPACRAALELARFEGALTDRRIRLVTRIGVHTGPMLVGNLGSEQRFDYTAIGDAVNTASRLESLNKHLGTTAIVSRATLDRTDGSFVARPLGRIVVVGKTEPIEVLELIGTRAEASRDPSALPLADRSPVSRAVSGAVAGGAGASPGEAASPGDGPLSAETIARFEAALADFVARRFTEAARAFREVVAMRGGADGPSEFYLRAIERFETSPPPAGWDGSVTIESK